MSGRKFKLANREDGIKRYDVLYGVFSKSGFTQRMLDAAKENSELLLINEDSLV